MVFYIGSVLIESFKLSSKEVFQSIFILFSGALGAGMSLSMMPNVKASADSAYTVYKLLEEKSQLDTRKTKDLKNIEQGEIEFKDVSFAYPMKKQLVLRKFSMVIPAGKKVAIIGHSGCGKSTLANLLLRFNKLRQGSILIDGKNLEDYDPAALRMQIGYVMQEPYIFNTSIK